MRSFTRDEIRTLDDARLSSAQASELERRLASLDDDLAEAVTWDELKADLTARAVTGSEP